MERLEHFFRLKDHKTTVSTEIAAGFTTFITMSYIILVNPELIASGVAAAGGPSDAVFNGVLIATCLASFIGRFSWLFTRSFLWRRLPEWALTRSLLFP